MKSAFWKNALEKIRVCAVVKKYRFWLCSVVLATTGLLESFWKHLESFWKHIASKMTIMGSNNSKVCNNKAFGNMSRMYTLGVWSGHMLQDKESLRLAQIIPDHHFLDEFFCCCWFCASWFLTISVFCAPGLRPSGRLDGHLGV